MRIINERASSVLYHFVDMPTFLNMMKKNCLFPSNDEQQFNGKGNRYISFSRNGSFTEGYPILLSWGYWKGENWCTIRITFDGDLMNQKPNFKIGKKSYNMKFKPFDWCHHAYSDEEDQKDIFGATGDNGKEIMMNSNSVDRLNKSAFDDGREEYTDKYNHPYSQAEDRLLTRAKKIPNIRDYIKRVDILLYPYNYEYTEEEEQFKSSLEYWVFSSMVDIHLYLEKLNPNCEITSREDILQYLS